MKHLVVTMPDGSKWAVPATEIAEHRANYYVSRDVDAVFNVEWTYAIHNDDVLKDWAENNMDWDDVKEFARQIAPSSEVDFQDGWVNGDKEVLEL